MKVKQTPAKLPLYIYISVKKKVSDDNIKAHIHADKTFIQSFSLVSSSLNVA